MNAKLFWLKFIFSLIFLLVKNQQVKAGKNDSEFPKMNVSEGALEIVTKMTNQLNEIAQPAADMSEKLKQNYRRLQKFIKVAIPVGAFAAAAMEIAFDPESEEMAALTKLHKEMNKQFEALAQRYEHLENKLISHQALTDYENEIVIPLESIREYFFLVCDPKTNRTHYRQQFVDRCQDRQSPYELLKIINRRVNRNCKTPTKLEASLSVQGMTLFDQIETKLSQFSTIDEDYFQKIRSESLYAFSSLSCCAEARKCLAPLINAVNRNNTDDDEALETVLLAFHRNLTARFRQSRSASVFPCLLKIINDDNKWLRQPLENIVELVTLDVDRLLPIGILCANVSNNGDPEGTEHDIHRIKRLTEEIYDGMEYYIEKKLRSTWPEIQRFYVNNTLDSDVPTNLYNETAAKLKNQLDLRGPYRFFHNVIVSEPWHGNSAYYANYKKTFGFEIWDYRMVNVFVTRYQDGQYNKARDAFHWWSRCFNNITTAIRIGYELYTYDLPKILDDIKTRTCSEPPSANSFLFLHTWKVWGSDEILAGVSNSTVTTIETIREVELYIPNNANRHRYRIYFIL